MIEDFIWIIDNIEYDSSLRQPKFHKWKDFYKIRFYDVDSTSQKNVKCYNEWWECISC